ncbi:hypothetical protein GUITHDRAFT_136947 [Guillardia theta CCMP2712]|uniref:PDZ domain-containing protein n=1 Tax=Guillardia theta (strain CCMP2712) TaxID=905079 RepID=L1JIQ8_GUITC|nr:hypothetical protein GUITHDRAFT_136947 [Guillardia theta CCMP2712]EKX47980.1 hypothetical protein GUITHDRAFT_136947 [Guillardia theta CCMP2712]|eukprot:XP_005834960.1 hypothetical protein GUITHDRAFT_136947 [Guillardia theta CCMP2712]
MTLLQGIHENESGVGLILHADAVGSHLVVRQVLPHSSAKLQDVQVGDEILAIDGISLSRDHMVPGGRSPLVGRDAKDMTVLLKRNNRILSKRLSRAYNMYRSFSQESIIHCMPPPGRGSRRCGSSSSNERGVSIRSLSELSSSTYGMRGNEDSSLPPRPLPLKQPGRYSQPVNQARMGGKRASTLRHPLRTLTNQLVPREQLDHSRDGAGRVLRTPGRRNIRRNSRLSEGFKTYAMEKILHGNRTSNFSDGYNSDSSLPSCYSDSAIDMDLNLTGENIVCEQQMPWFHR